MGTNQEYAIFKSFRYKFRIEFGCLYVEKNRLINCVYEKFELRRNQDGRRKRKIREWPL